MHGGTVLTTPSLVHRHVSLLVRYGARNPDLNKHPNMVLTLAHANPPLFLAETDGWGQEDGCRV